MRCGAAVVAMFLTTFLPLVFFRDQWWAAVVSWVASFTGTFYIVWTVEAIDRCRRIAERWRGASFTTTGGLPPGEVAAVDQLDAAIEARSIRVVQRQTRFPLADWERDLFTTAARIGAAALVAEMRERREK